MYEGQTIICQEIIEYNWIDFLEYVKEKAKENAEREKKRQELISSVEPIYLGADIKTTAQSDYPLNYWYDISINSFWNWYITTKIN